MKAFLLYKGYNAILSNVAFLLIERYSGDWKSIDMDFILLRA